MTELDEEKRSVESDLICVGCRYPLRGLSIEGACPECATPVDVSLRGFRLRTSDPAFARRIEAGLRSLLFSSLFLYVAVSCAVVSIFVWDVVVVRVLVAIGFCFAFMATSFTWIAGWWLLASEDRSVHTAASPTCMALRIFCVTQIASFAASALLVVFLLLSREVVGVERVVAAALAGVFVPSIGCMALGPIRLGHVAQLVDSSRIVDNVRTMRITLWIAIGGIVGAFPLSALSPQLGGIIQVAFLLLLLLANCAWPFMLDDLWRNVRSELPEEHSRV